MYSSVNFYKLNMHMKPVPRSRKISPAPQKHLCAPFCASLLPLITLLFLVQTGFLFHSTDIRVYNLSLLKMYVIKLPLLKILFVSLHWCMYLRSVYLIGVYIPFCKLTIFYLSIHILLSHSTIGNF